MTSALDIIDNAIAELEAKLNLKPGEVLPSASQGTKEKAPKKPKKEKPQNNPPKKKNASANNDQPDICKLEFKVGVITKVWVHPDADKLYCEEIDVGEEEPRQIASGLRPHYSLEQMEGQRLLVVSNLKPKKLAGFQSSGMVLCAAETKEDGTETVVFVEPPADCKVGEVISFEGLPPPEPFSGAQVEKKKIFQSCAEGMKTTEDGLASWNGHVFMTSCGPCKASLKNAMMR